MFQKVILKFVGTITKENNRGFIAEKRDNWFDAFVYGDEDVISFFDNNYSKLFKQGDIVRFRVENVEKKGEDKKNVFFGVITRLAENGFYYGERFEETFWSEIKGFLTASDSLSDNPYELGDIIRIEVK